MKKILKVLEEKGALDKGGNLNLYVGDFALDTVLDPDEIHLPGIYVDRLIQGTFEKNIEQRTVRSA